MAVKRSALEKFAAIQDWIDLKGKVWVTLFSLVMLYRVFMNTDISNGALTVYGIVLTNFMINGTVKAFKGD